MGASEYPLFLTSRSKIGEPTLTRDNSKCGSVPLFFPSDNNPNTHGILTMNYVGNGCGKSGLCI